MNQNNLFPQAKPGARLYLPGRALHFRAGRDPLLNQLIAWGDSQIKARLKNCTPARA